MQDGGLATANGFSSARYWEERYRRGGTSGAGSYGRLAAFKAAFVNGFLAMNNISRVIEFGCGDGNQLSLLSVPHYTGVDVSATVLERCRTRFPGHVFHGPDGLDGIPSAQLGLSMDVVFHLTEDSVFADYMRILFALSSEHVIIYASDTETRSADPHVRHRPVSTYVRRTFPDWSLAARVPNAYPFDPGRPNETSFSDFLVFSRDGRETRLIIPAIEDRTLTP